VEVKNAVIIAYEGCPITVTNKKGKLLLDKCLFLDRQIRFRDKPLLWLGIKIIMREYKRLVIKYAEASEVEKEEESELKPE
jgi:hypothetical protein